MTALTGDTAVWLIHAAESTEMHLPILMALCTGMRRGEILGLRWRDLDLDSCRLTVHQALEQTRASGVHFKTPKTARSRRTITIPKILVDVLAQHRKQTDERRRLFGADYLDADLVIALPDGSPWPPDRFTDAYVAFTRKIGARGIRFHDLRHTHASQLLREGIPVKTVAQRLGHANPSVTLNVYAHVMTGDDERAATSWKTCSQSRQAQPMRGGQIETCICTTFARDPKAGDWANRQNTAKSFVFWR